MSFNNKYISDIFNKSTEDSVFKKVSISSLEPFKKKTKIDHLEPSCPADERTELLKEQATLLEKSTAALEPRPVLPILNQSNPFLIKQPSFVFTPTIHQKDVSPINNNYNNSNIVNMYELKRNNLINAFNSWYDENHFNAMINTSIITNGNLNINDLIISNYTIMKLLFEELLKTIEKDILIDGICKRVQLIKHKMMYIHAVSRCMEIIETHKIYVNNKKNMSTISPNIFLNSKAFSFNSTGSPGNIASKKHYNINI